MNRSRLFLWITGLLMAAIALMAPGVAQALTPVSFGAPTQYSVGTRPTSVAIGRFGNDSYSDLAVTNSGDLLGNGGNDVSVLVGDAQGHFTGPTNFPVGYSPRSVAVGEFDGNSLPDLATANAGLGAKPGNVSILKGQPGKIGAGGGFSAPATFQAEPYALPSSVVIGRFDSGNSLDLAVANASGDVSILLGDGAGGFSAPRNFAAGNTPFSLAIGDFNSDGISDLAVADKNPCASFTSCENTLLLGTGDGNFTAAGFPAQNFASPTAIVVADFNSDGIDDIAVTDNYTDDVSITLGNGSNGTGDGTFSTQHLYKTGHDPEGIAVGDLNGDGVPDLAVAANTTTGVSVLLGVGDGTFSPQQGFAAGTPQSVAVGDLNGDGQCDIVVANRDTNTATVLLNTTSSTATSGCGSQGGNQRPTASFVFTPTSPQAGQAVSFDGTASSDPDGTIASYSWNFGDGHTATGATASHTYLTAGTYTVELTVTDNGGLTGTTTHTLTVGGSSSSSPLDENFEGGAAGWSMNGFWHIQDHPEAISVVSPSINPDLVSLPDQGQLPAAFAGTHAAWFGQTATGTFCGADFGSVAQTAKDGCTSSGIKQGDLTSPSFSLVGATSAVLHFDAWFEIEAVDADQYDLMTVQYSTDNGAIWNDLGKLNPPNNPAGKDDQSYSNRGLETPGKWLEYSADLSAAAGQPSVRVRIDFDTADQRFNGFRGLLVDNVKVGTQYDVPAPSISSIAPSCQAPGTQTPVVLEGSNFTLGSSVKVDGVARSASVLSPQRIEFLASDLGEGSHQVVVVPSRGNTSNAVTLTIPCRPATLELTPKSGSDAVGSEHCLTATVTDQDGHPSAGVTVSFAVSGANNTGGSFQTDADGQTGGCYTGNAAGNDTITAFVDANGNGTQDAGEPGDQASEQWFVPAPQPPAPPPPVHQSTTIQPLPSLGHTTIIAPLKGVIRYRPRGSAQFIVLSVGLQIPIGSIIDARSGVVQITIAVLGGTETVLLEDGLVQVRQGRDGLADLGLSGGSFGQCRNAKPGHKASASRSRRRNRTLRKLFVNGTGRFRVSGRYSKTLVGGTKSGAQARTITLVQDRCDGTRTDVEEGNVSVVGPRRRPIHVSANHWVFIPAPGVRLPVKVKHGAIPSPGFGPHAAPGSASPYSW